VTFQAKTGASRVERKKSNTPRIAYRIEVRYVSQREVFDSIVSSGQNSSLRLSNTAFRLWS
jgi:hypothetical protein